MSSEPPQEDFHGTASMSPKNAEFNAAKDGEQVTEALPVIAPRSHRMWNPVHDTRPPSEEEFSKVEKAFGRFINFMKNRDEAGLSPESVRLLHTFYMELDGFGSGKRSEADNIISTLSHTNCPVNELANNIPFRRQLESRHLSVLINLIIMMVEEEQKMVQKLFKFGSLLADATDNIAIADQISLCIKEYPEEKLLQLKALTQEHIRLKIDFIAKLKTGRSLMVKGLEGSNRLLSVLRKKSAKHQRKLAKQEISQLRESFYATSPKS